MFDISIIIPTYKRRALLRKTLDSILQQAAEDIAFELIVVDNNSQDGTQELLLSYVSESRRPIQVVLENQAGCVVCTQCRHM